MRKQQLKFTCFGVYSEIMTMHPLIRSPNIESIIDWNVAGELHIPKNMTVGSNSPCSFWMPLSIDLHPWFKYVSARFAILPRVFRFSAPSIFFLISITWTSNCSASFHCPWFLYVHYRPQNRWISIVVSSIYQFIVISFLIEYHHVIKFSPDRWMNLPWWEQVKTWLISHVLWLISTGI